MSFRTEDYDARQIAAHFDAPAYVRRARHVAGAWSDILERCRRQREAWLEIPRLRLALLQALAGDWSNIERLLGNAELTRSLGLLYERWRPRLRVKVQPTSSIRRLRQAHAALCDSFGYFNCRWDGFVRDIDLTGLNRLREAYNQYYLLEKECAIRSQTIARYGYQPLSPATLADLFAEFPLLQVPHFTTASVDAHEGRDDK